MTLISISLFFIIAVARVDAAVEFGAFNGDSDVAWWVGTENNYLCNGNCPSFNRIVIPFYGYKTSTDNNMVFGFNFYIKAVYLDLYPVTQTVNVTPYALWSTDNDLWNNWSLIDSCTITGTTTQSGSAVITKEWNYQVNCNGKPPSANHFPTIYFLLNKTQSGNVILDEFGTIYSALTYNIVQGTETGVIVDNSNQNAQNIIDNNDKNTQDIIDNQNKNAEDTQNTIKDQFISCENYNYKVSDNISETNSYLKNDGTIGSNNSYNISNYTPVEKGQTYTIKSVGSTPSYCLYDKNKNLLNCTQYASQGTIIVNPTENGYIKYTMTKTGSSNGFTGQYCYNRLDGQPHDYGSQPDSTTTNEYHTKEQTLMDNFNSSQLNVVDINVDTNSNKWVWDRITEYINLNSIITTMIITIMSLGVIKLVMNR